MILSNIESSKKEVTSSSKSTLLVRFFNLYIEIISSSPPLKLITFVSKFILNSLLNLLISTLLNIFKLLLIERYFISAFLGGT